MNSSETGKFWLLGVWIYKKANFLCHHFKLISLCPRNSFLQASWEKRSLTSTVYRTILCKLASSKDIFNSLVWGEILKNMIWKLNDEKLSQTFRQVDNRSMNFNRMLKICHLKNGIWSFKWSSTFPQIQNFKILNEY